MTRPVDSAAGPDLYRAMALIRQTELRLARSHREGLVHGACHTYVGEEAIAAGVCAHLREDDFVFSTHRGHGHALAKGLPPAELIAELYGREHGCSGGRGGSMHLFKPEIGLMGTSGIVGPSILQACGGGYSALLRGTDQVAVVFFGDGAVNNGAFHEGLNMAAIWNLPVIFVCENNQFATEVPFSASSASPHVGRRAAMYGLPGHELDGNDVMAIHRVAGEAIANARSGNGATLIECRTYRTRPHAEGMGDFGYRTREEVEAWKDRCPIRRLREAPGLDSADLDRIDEEVERGVDDAHEVARQAPVPDPATAALHVHGRDEPAAVISPEPGERRLTFTAAAREALELAMERDEGIFVLGEGIGARGGNFGTTTGLFDRFGERRLRDTPICERGFVGLACGAAMTGTRPVVDSMFIDFVNDAFGEIVNQIAKMQYMSGGRLSMPVLLRGCIGIGHNAATHHSGCYQSVYAHFPGLRVVVPATPYDAKGLLAHALRGPDPVLFLEHRELLALEGPVPEEDYEVAFGVAACPVTGEDVTVVAIGGMQPHAIEAARTLAGEGISVEVIDPRTVSPLDTATIGRSVAKTGRLLVVDEGFEPCNVGAEIAACVADRGFDDLDAPIRRLSGMPTPTPYSPSLEEAVVPDAAAIVAAIRDLLDE